MKITILPDGTFLLPLLPDYVKLLRHLMSEFRSAPVSNWLDRVECSPGVALASREIVNCLIFICSMQQAPRPWSFAQQSLATELTLALTEAAKQAQRHPGTQIEFTYSIIG